MNAGTIWVLIPIFGILAWVITTWIRARHGYPLDGAARGGEAGSQTPHKTLQEELKERDRMITDLEERVRVLERIVTDQSSKLGEEIDRLRA